MQLQTKYNLPFFEIGFENGTKHLHLPAVLVDTGSASTLLSADLLNEIGIFPEPNDLLKTI
jgi:hypothetical protein